MNTASPICATGSGGTPSCVPALLTWLGIQFLALWLGASGLPLCADPPQPPQRLALGILLVAQVAASALLFPFLLRTVSQTLLILLTSLPFLQLAGFLSVTPHRRLILAGAGLIIWLIGLAIWQRRLTCEKSRLIAIAIATVLAAGGPLLWYLHAEFSPHSPL